MPGKPNVCKISAGWVSDWRRTYSREEESETDGMGGEEDVVCFPTPKGGGKKSQTIHTK